MSRPKPLAREMLTLDEAAALAGVGRKLIQKLAREDANFPVFAFGVHKRRVLKSALIDYFSKRRTVPLGTRASR